MSTEPGPSAGFPPPAGPLRLLNAGREAFREVQGLRVFLIKGFLINYLVFFLVAAVVMGFGYVLIVQPMVADLFAEDPGQGFWSSLFHVVLVWLAWIAGVLLTAATLIISVVVSLALMSLWLEALAGRVIAHWRPDVPAPPFSWGAWIGSIGRSLLSAIWLLVLAVLALILGFVPVVGPVLVLIMGSYLLGREVRDPYLVLRRELDRAGQDRGNKLRAMGMAWWTGRVGMLPFLLATVPLVGWLLLPITLIYLVAGVSWEAERLRAQAD